MPAAVGMNVVRRETAVGCNRSTLASGSAFMSEDEAKQIADLFVRNSDTIPCEFSRITFLLAEDVPIEPDEEPANDCWMLSYRFTEEEQQAECPGACCVLVDNLTGEARFLSFP